MNLILILNYTVVMRVYQKWIWYGVVNFMFLLQGILADDCTDETDLICRSNNKK